MSNNLLKNKKGIIFGALDDDSLAWKVAEKCKEEGAIFTLSNTRIALRMGKLNELSEKCNSKIIAADVTDIDDIKKVITESVDFLGGKIDFILHSVGMSNNVRKKLTYDNLNYKFLNKTLDVSAISFHKIIKIAYQEDALNDYASILALSYIAAQRVFSGYNDMGDAKALLEEIARNFGYILGREKNIRINTISQSPTKTKAGSGVKDFDKLYKFTDKMSPLGNADSDSLADYCVTLFSDYTRKVTMQNLFHDGGFVNMGMSREVVNAFMRGND